MKYSIIVPAYNTEKYIDKCLKSIFSNTYKNFEVIIVNDGSTDKTEDIINKYIKKYDNIIYIKQKNMGLSLARNNGVKKATGDYLLFIDSDDYVEKNLLENINKDIDDLDVLRYQLNMVFNDKIIPYGEKEFNVTNGIDAFEKIVRYKFIEMAALYVINRKYYLDNNFMFEKDVYHEDYGLLPLVIATAKKVKSINYLGYNYVQRDGSIMSSNDTEKYLKNCIDSLLKQNFEDYEIIVINDLSPGNAEEIIKSYNDKKIVYIKNKTNKGIGYNRNLGIKKAKGEYVCFIDSDDYVKEDFISKMYNYSKENNLDLCVCDYVNVDEEGNKLKEFNLSDFCITNYEENNKILCEINLAPWNKLYKKDMLVKNKIEFSETLKYEDLSFVALSIKNSKKIGKINEQLNYYTIHKNSETTTRDKRVFDIFKQLDIVRNEYKSGKYLDELTVSVLLNYTIQQRYQIDKDTQSKFIDDAFKYLNDNNIDYKHSEYIKNRSFLKRLIEKNKFITKIYCKIYSMLKTR